MSTERIVIAGRTQNVGAANYTDYIREHWKTVRHYDLLPEPRTVGPELIRATRSPYMGSRISAREAEWFTEHARSAPWGEIATDASLADADPTQPGGLYDAAAGLYHYFLDQAPKGVAAAKVSKVLHLMRPGLVPILDSRLLGTYRSVATAAAKRVGGERPELRSAQRMYWAAIRDDLLVSQAALSAIRQQLHHSDDALVREAAGRLSDLRLLDMVTWKQ